MQQNELKEIFDQQAADYDNKSERVAPIYEALYFLLEAVFAGLPPEASLLCVGVGTGAELVHLAQTFPRWQFTAVDPSGAMLEECHRKVKEMGFVDRCHFHEGYVESLPADSAYDAATCFLVSQFFLDKEVRGEFFRSIAQRLKPGGILASSDLAADVHSKIYEELLKDWSHIMKKPEDATSGSLDQLRETYDKHVSILPPETVASIIKSADFEDPVPFFQAGLVHAWHSRRKQKSIE